MDAKRLEELTAWAINESSDLEEYGDALARKHRQNLADLARCAAAWAKVERAKASVTYQNGAWHCAFGWFTHTIQKTALAAVEAAPEVTP